MDKTISHLLIINSLDNKLFVATSIASDFINNWMLDVRLIKSNKYV